MISELFSENSFFLSCIWQSTICVVLGLISSFILKRRPCRAHQILLLTLIAAVFVSVMSVIVKHCELGVFVTEPVVTQAEVEDRTATIDNGALEAATIEDTEHQTSTSEEYSVSTFMVQPESIKIHWAQVILVLWIVASIVLTIRLFLTFVLSIRLLGRAQPLDCKKIQNAVHVAKEKLEIGRNVQVCSSNSIKSPVIWCWGRQAVLLVPSSVERSGNKLDWVSVVCHELAHWKRQDHISGMVAELIVCVLPWHPLIWWAKRRLLRLSEHICDDWVVACGQVGEDYAESLLDLAPCGRMLFTPAVVSSKKDLKDRVYRILQDKCHNPRLGILWSLTTSIGALLLATGVAFSQSRPAATSNGNITESTKSKTLSFPKERSIGKLMIEDMSITANTVDYPDLFGHRHDWQYFGEAKGEVTIPAGKRVQLVVNNKSLQDLSGLMKLKHDDLWSMVIRGSLDDSPCLQDKQLKYLSGLTGLKELSLYRSGIKGNGLVHLKDFDNLEHLIIFDEPQLTNIACVHISKLKSLKFLVIASEKINDAGLAKLGNLKSLKALHIRSPKLSGAGFERLQELPLLTYLELRDNKFGDEGLVYISKLKNLKRLHFLRNPISDNGLKDIAKLQELEDLKLYDTMITDKGINYLQPLRSLKSLDIQQTKVTDESMEQIARFEKLENLSLPDGLTAKGFEHLTKLKNLKFLWVGNRVSNPFGDRELEHIGNIHSLEELTIGGTGITDAGLSYIGKLSNLKKFSLFSASQITNAGLAQLGKLKSLESLNLSLQETKVTVSGINQLNGLGNLNYLDVTGIKPDNEKLDISGLSKLEKLTISPPVTRRGKELIFDQFTDADLACIAKLENLKWFQGFHGVTDSGMAHLSGLTKMERLSIGGPNLTDEGLKHLSRMKNLDFLLISDGKFTDKSLRYLEKHKALELLDFWAGSNFSQEAISHLQESLPNLHTFRTGTDTKPTKVLTRGRTGG